MADCYPQLTVAPESRPKRPKRKGSYSNHPFSGAKMLVSGRVIVKLMNLEGPLRLIHPHGFESGGITGVSDTLVSDNEKKQQQNLQKNETLQNG